MPLIVPYFAVGSSDEIVIDGVTYKVPRVDSVGRVSVTPYPVGSSEVTAARGVGGSPSTTRSTVATPASGKKIRIISCVCINRSVTLSGFEVYFGTGTDITTNPGKEIMFVGLDATNIPQFGLAWPDGAGPVGAADDVVSMRTVVDITTNGVVVIHYREE